MKKLLLLLSLLFTINSYSQESHLGKTADEIYTACKDHKCYDHFKLQNKKTLHVILDDSTVDIYIFNDNNICIEYDHVVMNTTLEGVSASLSKDYMKTGDVYQSVDNQFLAEIQQITETSFRIRIKKFL